MSRLGTSRRYRCGGTQVQTRVLWLGEAGVVYSTNAVGLDLQIVMGFKWQS